MLDTLVNLLGEYGNPVPRFTGPRCLVERMAVGGCDLCQQACPHDAITIDRTVTIDEKLCTGCGLCTQVCPSGALEFDVSAVLGAVREQPEPEPARLVCSQSGEAGKQLLCLARVTPSVVVAAGAWDRELHLVHGDCAACSVGGPGVPEQLERVVREAQLLRESTTRLARVRIRRGEAGGGRADGVSRRGVFGSMFRSARTVAAELVPEQPLPFVDWSVPQERVPQDLVWRRRALKPTPASETPVYWPSPVVDEKCIFCPVCANVCPTQAISREVQADGAVHLMLQLDACTGCDACARSCPPQAITLTSERPMIDLDLPVLMRDSGGPV
jgi:ferredoxin